MLRREAGDLSMAQLVSVRESTEQRSGQVGVGWVVNALRAQHAEHDIPIAHANTSGNELLYVGVGDKQRLVTVEDLARYIGCEDVRGSHGISQKQNPLGTDKPLPGWPFPRPSRAEILRALEEQAA